MADTITIMLVRSRAGKTPAQRKCLDALGLKRREVARTISDTPAVRGIINKIPHLVTIVSK
ncbi:MAG: 50S ribosomal protein L30 [Desulfovibrionaceae bacterium]|nr:50S ribosomal protein L30 [Desulfovibrionaceae bacterium]